MPLEGVPLLSANFELEVAVAYPPRVGRFGSLASKRARLRVPSPLPPEASELMLAFRCPEFCTLPSSASVGVAVLLGILPPAVGASCLLVLSSGYGKGPVGGGDVGAPKAVALLDGGTL